MDFKMIKRLVKLVNTSGVMEIEVREGDQTIRVRRSCEIVQKEIPTALVSPQAQTTLKPLPPTTEANQNTYEATIAEQELAAGSTTVKTPMVGTFYNSPSPGDQPFVTIGQTVSKGDTVCIVEAMKTMNEIPSPADGVIRKILVNNASGVEYGQSLMIIEEL